MAVRSAPRICVELGLYAKSFKRLNVVVTAHRCLRRRAPLCASFPKFLVASICDLPDVIDCQFREFVAALLGRVHFLSPDQQSRIHCLIICAFQLLTPNNLGRT